MSDSLAASFLAVHGRPPEILAHAPGRIEFIGNHTDYNGGPVLGAALDRGISVALALRSDGRRRFATEARSEVIERGSEDENRLSGTQSWVNYPLGVILAMRAFGFREPRGFDYLAASDLPIGAGLSSSAAIELASGLAFLESVGEHPARDTLVQIGKHAENQFVGVPCGILDQGVSGFGRKDHLVFIDCRGPRFETVALPPEGHFWLFNTHTRHALVDGLYAERHRECLEAARLLGVSLLVEATCLQLDAAQPLLPMAVFKRARHIVDEITRVRETVAALRFGDLRAVGRLLLASHLSSRIWFENSTPELDFLVDRLAIEPEVFGARLTGGGFGGAVMALSSPGFTQATATRVVSDFAARFGAEPEVLHAQTGEGAALLNSSR